MSDLKKLRTRFADAYNDKDLETMMGLYKPDAEVLGRPHGALRGRAEIRADWDTFLKNMPAGKVTLVHQAAEGSVLFTEWTFSASGQEVTARGVDVAEFEDEKLRLQRWYYPRS